jgi:nitrite reductase/ring-hydroxylating ferredoxin subunit
MKRHPKSTSSSRSTTKPGKASARTPAGYLRVAEHGYGRIAVVPKEDAELTRVGFGTPMGELLRRYWQPVALSAELADLPKAVRILGEDLVAFRDKSGRVGVLDAHCVHRGTSLEYGRIEEDGIRCCYHGWKFAPDGRCLEMPAEPPTSRFKDKVCQPGYPALEYGGLVFAYMGPPDRVPELPRYDCLHQEGTVLSAYRNFSRGIVAGCNWLQIQENVMDPVHTAFLHALNNRVHFTDVYKTLPELDFGETPMGMKYVRTARLPNGRTFVRVQEILMPNVRVVSETQVGGEPMTEHARVVGWWVPVDDTHTVGFHLEALRVENGRPVPSSLATAHVGRSTMMGDARTSYEDTQRDPDDLEAQVSQRPIAIHALERKGTTDRGVIMCRKLLRRALRDMAAGRDPQGIIRDPAQRVIQVVSGNTVIAAPHETVTAGSSPSP